MNLVESPNSSSTLGFNSGSTYTQDSSDLMFDLIDMLPNPAIQHRNHFRGKFLGSEVTADQISNIRNGRFKDIWIGDYWTDSSGMKWRVADINYYWHKLTAPFLLDVTNPSFLKTNHVLVMPDKVLFNMTSDYTLDQPLTDGGVANQKWLKEAESKAMTYTSIFAKDSYLMELPRMLSSGMNDAANLTSRAASMRKIIVPTEAMITGSNYFAPQQPGDKATMFNNSYEQWQLKLFKLGGTKYISSQSDYLTSDGFSTSQKFAAVSVSCRVYAKELKDIIDTNRAGIRPLIPLG